MFNMDKGPFIELVANNDRVIAGIIAKYLETSFAMLNDVNIRG